MRGTLLKFNEETAPSLPSAVASDLGLQVKRIDSTEAMGIPDDAREWFVFHMMKKAERNNVSMETRWQRCIKVMQCYARHML